MSGPGGSDDVVVVADVELLGAAALARGRELYVAGDLRGASEAFRDAAAADPGDPEALHGLAKAVRRVDAVRARAALVRAVRLRPGFFEGWRALATLCLEEGDAPGLARAVEEARRAAPSAAAAAALALDFPPT